MVKSLSLYLIAAREYFQGDGKSTLQAVSEARPEISPPQSQKEMMRARLIVRLGRAVKIADDAIKLMPDSTERLQIVAACKAMSEQCEEALTTSSMSRFVELFSASSETLSRIARMVDSLIPQSIGAAS